MVDGDVDMIDDPLVPSQISLLTGAEDIQIESTPRNGYGYLAINCDKYPLDITAFRRALAFALDKEAVSQSVWAGHSDPIDACVPPTSSFSVEGSFSYSYHTAQIALANNLLNDAGFVDVDADDYRDAPDGSPFEIVLEIDGASETAVGTGDEVVEALEALGITVSIQSDDYSDTLDRITNHLDYDIALLEKDFDNFDVDWLGIEFVSDSLNRSYFNLANFENASYDSWLTKLMYNNTLEAVTEASAAMQEIIAYECPIIPVYRNDVVIAYRTDTLEGYVNDFADGIAGWWTNYKIRMQTAGGLGNSQFRIATSQQVDTYNYVTSRSRFAKKINSMLCDQLIRQSPQGEDIFWMIDDGRLMIETHADNDAVPDGHTRFTVDLIQNATFLDGSPLTAYDVAESLVFFRESQNSSISHGLEDAVAIYAPTPYRFIVEYSTESYWHMHHFAYKSIFPETLLDSIGILNATSWNPYPPLLEAGYWMSSGPFMLFSTGWFSDLILVANTEYYFPVGVEDDLSCEPPYIENHDLSWGVSENRSLPFMLSTNVEFNENLSIVERINVEIRNLTPIQSAVSAIPASSYLARFANGTPFSLSGVFSYGGFVFSALQPAVPIGDWDTLTQLVPPLSCIFGGAVATRTTIINTIDFWGFHDEFYIRLSGLGVVRIETESTWLKTDGTLRKVHFQLDTAFGLIEVQIVRVDVIDVGLMLVFAFAGIGIVAIAIVVQRRKRSI